MADEEVVFGSFRGRREERGEIRAAVVGRSETIGFDGYTASGECSVEGYGLVLIIM